MSAPEVSVREMRLEDSLVNGMARYSVSFEIVWMQNKLRVAIPVETTEGWEVARLLACVKLGELGGWLARAMNKEVNFRGGGQD